MTDPYQILGLARDATADDIHRAYRKLAKQYHPDLNPGNKGAEEKFKEVSAANDLLSDADKRARFDRGEIDGAGDPRAPERPFYRQQADTGFSARYGTEEMSDIFADLFAQGGPMGGGGPMGSGPMGGMGARNRPARGRDAAYTLTVSFEDAVTGEQQRLTLPDGRTLDVRIPPGMEDGKTLRLRGQGGEGALGGPAGDALITVNVAAHTHFRREGDDVVLDLPVTLKEAVLGGRVATPTVAGRVNVTVPPGSDSGTVLRLRGRGVPARAGKPAGDQRVVLRVVLADADEALAGFLREWTPAREVDPRRDLP